MIMGPVPRYIVSWIYGTIGQDESSYSPRIAVDGDVRWTNFFSQLTGLNI